jgi:hypothetical protein
MNEQTEVPLQQLGTYANVSQQLVPAANSEGAKVASKTAHQLPTSSVLINLWQCRMEIDKPTNNSWQCQSFVDNVLIDLWQCRMEIDKVKSNKREQIASHSSIKQDKSTPTFQLVVASVSNKREPIASHSSIKYLPTSQVPPFWTELVCASSKLHLCTERQVDTWQ